MAVDFVALFFYPVRELAFSPTPILCFSVVMLASAFILKHEKFSCVICGVCGFCWIGFAFLEVNTSPSNNIRIDLALLGPIFSLALYLWIAALFYSLLNWIKSNK